MAGTYIQTTDITDNVVNNLGTTVVGAKVDLSDDAVEDMAEEKGVDSGDIETDPVHFLVTQWAVAWVCYQLCKDYLGTNNLDSLEQEKYAVKGKIYFEEMASFYSRINQKVLTGNVAEEQDRAGIMTGTIWRTS